MAKRIPNGEQYNLCFTAALYFVHRTKANKQTAWNIWFNNVLNAKVTYIAAHYMVDSRYHLHINRHLMQTWCKLVSICCYWHKSSTAWPLVFFTFVNIALCFTLAVCRFCFQAVDWLAGPPDLPPHSVDVWGATSPRKSAQGLCNIKLFQLWARTLHSLFIINDGNPLLSPCELRGVAEK